MHDCDHLITSFILRKCCNLPHDLDTHITVKQSSLFIYSILLSYINFHIPTFFLFKLIILLVFLVNYTHHSHFLLIGYNHLRKHYCYLVYLFILIKMQS